MAYMTDDNGDRIIEIKMKVTPDNVLPAEFKAFYMRVARETPEEIVQEMLDQEIERLRKSIENSRNWEKYKERISYGE